MGTPTSGQLVRVPKQRPEHFRKERVKKHLACHSLEQICTALQHHVIRLCPTAEDTLGEQPHHCKIVLRREAIFAPREVGHDEVQEDEGGGVEGGGAQDEGETMPGQGRVGGEDMLDQTVGTPPQPGQGRGAWQGGEAWQGTEKRTLQCGDMAEPCDL